MILNLAACFANVNKIPFIAVIFTFVCPYYIIGKEIILHTWSFPRPQTQSYLSSQIPFTFSPAPTSSTEAELAPKREGTQGEATALEALLRGDSLLEKKNSLTKEEETLMEIQVLCYLFVVYQRSLKYACSSVFVVANPKSSYLFFGSLQKLMSWILTSTIALVLKQIISLWFLKLMYSMNIYTLQKFS